MQISIVRLTDNPVLWNSLHFIANIYLFQIKLYLMQEMVWSWKLLKNFKKEFFWFLNNLYADIKGLTQLDC